METDAAEYAAAQRRPLACRFGHAQIQRHACTDYKPFAQPLNAPLVIVTAFVALASGRPGSSKKAKSDFETRGSHRRSVTGGRGGGGEGTANVSPGKEEKCGKDRRPAGKRVCGEGAGEKHCNASGRLTHALRMLMC